MSKAEYLAAFGVPMSPEEAQRCIDRDREIWERWVMEILPKLRLHPSPKQWFKLLFVCAEEIPIPPNDRLAQHQVTTMSGIPLHRFKRMDGLYFYAGPVLSPGFPGS